MQAFFYLTPKQKGKASYFWKLCTSMYIIIRINYIDLFMDSLCKYYSAFGLCTLDRQHAGLFKLPMYLNIHESHA